MVLRRNAVVIKKVVAMVAVALTALLLLPPDPADARRGGGFRGGGGGGFRAARVVRAPVFRPRVVVGRPLRVYRPVRVVRRGPVIVTGYGGCEWLRQRAIITGSPYWWRRYALCRGY